MLAARGGHLNAMKQILTEFAPVPDYTEDAVRFPPRGAS